MFTSYDLKPQTEKAALSKRANSADKAANPLDLPDPDLPDPAFRRPLPIRWTVRPALNALNARKEAA